MVHHGGVEVNGKKTDVPSFQAKPGDVIKVRPKVAKLVKLNAERFPDHTPPTWLIVKGEGEGQMSAVPTRADIDTAVEEHFVVESYSR